MNLSDMQKQRIAQLIKDGGGQFVAEQLMQRALVNWLLAWFWFAMFALTWLGILLYYVL